MGGHYERYELVMPFLPVVSRGGPYDDEAFAAGYRMGRLDGDLAQGVDHPRPIGVGEREQADLIAMRHGYAARFVSERGGWLWLSLEFAAVGDDTPG